MKLNKEQLDSIASQVGIHPDHIEPVDIPLPIENAHKGVFQVKFADSEEYIVGSLRSRLGDTWIRLEGYDGYEYTDKALFFKSITDLADSGKIEAFHWLTNPMDYPEWNNIPEPPECKIYRFRYYLSDIGEWREGVASPIGDSSVWWCTKEDGKSSGPIQTLKAIYGEHDASWIDPCPELGNWPGN